MDAFLLALVLFAVLSLFVLLVGLYYGDRLGFRRGAHAQRRADQEWHAQIYGAAGWPERPLWARQDEPVLFEPVMRERKRA